ncbi:ABC transporter ATP-binding protein [Candidatus Latescibacterota bacterium]
MLEVKYITKNYSLGSTPLEVLRGVTFDLNEGQIAAVVGESGAGKSTLLHILGMLDRPSTGHVILNGDELSMKSDSELAKYRNQQVGFIFQFHHLMPEFNAFENVIMPGLIAGKKPKDLRERAEYLLDRVGLSQRINHRPGELSGGELQRVAVARALINEPALVLADEPSGNLDHHNSEMLHDLIWNLASEQKCTFIIVTHDMSIAKKADRVMHLRDGFIKEIDPEKFSELTFLNNV